MLRNLIHNKLINRFNEQDIDGQYYYMVVCSNWKPNQNHFYQSYNANMVLSLELLKRLFDPEAPRYPPDVERGYNMFQRPITRQKICSITCSLSSYMIAYAN